MKIDFVIFATRNLFNELLHFDLDGKINQNEIDITIAVGKTKSTPTIIAKLCVYQLQLYGYASYLKDLENKVNINQLSNY